MTAARENLQQALAGRYTIERELGAGGMATVYLARDPKHDRDVALKVLKPELSARIGSARFQAEIETTARLQHPHILPLFDSGEAAGSIFYVMPYVEGESLRDRVDREGQLPVDEAVAITRKVAAALQAAHDAGVVHRDIKPANILLSRGEPLVADFGIALAMTAGGAERLTETGLFVGTPHYVGPEQATGEGPVGAATDVYALGCVLYEMLVGHPPFTGSTIQSVMASVLTGRPAPASAERPRVPPNVDAALERALEKLPADRFRTADAFAAALADPGFRHRDDRGARLRSPRVATGIAVVLALVLLIVSGWAILRPPAPPDGPLFRLPMRFADDQQLAGTGYFDLARDGSLLVYQGVGEDGTTRLWVRRGAADEAVPIAGTEDLDPGIVPDILISPDAERVGFWRDFSLHVVPMDGGVPRTVADSVAGWARWSPDGRWIYLRFLRSPGLWRVPAAGGEREPVTHPDTAAGESHMWPDILPSSDALVYEVRGPEGSRIVAHDLATGEVSDLVEGRYPRYADGRLFFANEQGTRLLSAPFDADRLRLTGSPRALVDGLDGLGHATAGSVGYAVSHTGVLAYAPRREWRLVWVTRDGARRDVAPGWSLVGTPTDPVLSPDGSRVALSMGTPGERDVFIKELDDGPLTRMTLRDGEERPLDWLDDETVLFYASGESGRDLWTSRADRSAPPTLRHDHDQDVQRATVARGGDPIAFTDVPRNWQTRDGADLYALEQDGGAARRLLAIPGSFIMNPALSPGARWIAYEANTREGSEIVVRPYPDLSSRRVQVSIGGGSSPVWSRDGSELFYVSGNRELVSVDFSGGLTPSMSRERLFTVGPDLAVSSIQVTANGRFLMTRSEPKIVLLFNWADLAEEGVVD